MLLNIPNKVKNKNLILLLINGEVFFFIHPAKIHNQIDTKKGTLCPLDGPSSYHRQTGATLKGSAMYPQNRRIRHRVPRLTHVFSVYKSHRMAYVYKYALVCEMCK